MLLAFAMHHELSVFYVRTLVELTVITFYQKKKETFHPGNRWENNFILTPFLITFSRCTVITTQKLSWFRVSNCCLLCECFFFSFRFYVT